LAATAKAYAIGGVAFRSDHWYAEFRHTDTLDDALPDFP
jgi:hypothetical protein